jgi:Flp pilus assembly protein CpaB
MANPTHPSTASGSNRHVIIALALALVAVVLVNLYVAMVKRQAHEGEFTVYRLVTSYKPGQKLSPKDVVPVSIPQRFLKSFEGTVMEESTEDDQALTAVVGTRIKSPARRNQFLTYDLFTDPNLTEMDTRITPNMRLVAMPVNPRTLPGGLQPGMFIDIEAQFPGGSLNVLPVMERVEVIAVGSRTIAGDANATGRGSRNFTTISIQVSPDDATSLEKIKKLVVGDFELHMRNPADNSTPKIPEGGINPQVLKLIDR